MISTINKVNYIIIEGDVDKDKLIGTIKHCHPDIIYNKIKTFSQLLYPLFDEIEDLALIIDIDTNHIQSYFII